MAIGILALVGCAKAGNTPPVDGGGNDGPPDADVDAMPVAGQWHDDSAEDFTPGTRDGIAIEPAGAITSAAYYTGGLLWRASNTSTFDAAASATWASVSAYPATGKVAITRSTALAFGADTPPSVGLTDPDTFAMWFEGEVFLDAGSYTFEMLADDHGFVELAPAANGAFTRVASCDWPTAATGVFTAPAAGWYPIRFAGSEGAGDALIQLRVQGPGITPLQPIPRHRLRAPVRGLVGMFQSGFDDGHLLGDVEHTIDQVTPANTNWNTGNPGDLGMTAADDFSVRWTGQLRIDVAGAYTFRSVTDDGQRLWVDGQRLLDAWDDTTHDQTSAALTLDAGWHDLVVDHSESAGGAIAVVSIASGPELAGQPLPLDRLRPVEGRGERYETGVDRTDRAIPAFGQAPDSQVTLTAPTGATVTGIDVSYSFTHTYWGDLEIRLIAPNGTQTLLRDNTGGSTSGTTTQRLYTAALNGAPVAGTWLLRVNDTASSDAGTLLDFQITPHYAGGEPPIATAGTYDSPVKDLGGTATLTRVAWSERLVAGAGVAVRIRSGETAAACTASAWSAPLAGPAGSTPAVPAGRFVQYRVELTSNGERGPAVDEVTIDYLVAP
jgi:subtilisin-like proprotein convertase family protein